MSSQITDAFVQQYGQNVFHLSQQKGSRLRSAVRFESVVGKNAFFDRVGAATAQLRVSRHADTPQIDTPNSRRRLSLADYEYADLIDQADKVRLLIDPQSAYVQAAMWAMGRSMDDVIIEAISGTAYSRETGSTAVTLPNAQKIAAVASGAGSNLNVMALRNAKKVLDAADVDPSIPRYCAVEASQVYALLGQTEVTSSDYNVVKALAMGEIDTFLGFKFIMINRLGTQGSALSFDQSTGAVGSGSGDANGYRKVLCWAQDGIALGVGKDIMARVSERDDKSYSTQVYACMSLGAVRMEEEKVVQILCSES